MSELTDRLRGYAQRFEDGSDDMDDEAAAPDLLRAAAGHIDQLDAEVQRLREGIKQYADAVMGLSSAMSPFYRWAKTIYERVKLLALTADGKGRG